MPDVRPPPRLLAIPGTVVRIFSSRRLNALLVVLGWLGLLVVGFAPPDSIPLDTGESVFARVFFWLPVLLVGSAGTSSRYWQPPVAPSQMRTIKAWRTVLVLSVLVVALDIVANTVIMSIVLGRESVWFISYPLLPAVLLSIRAAIEIRRLTLPPTEPRELLQ